MTPTVKFKATRARVKNRGIPPVEFLSKLVEWGKTAPDEIFKENYVFDVYSSVRWRLGPYRDLIHRKAVMLEVMRVLAGFESSWNWNEGVDVTNPSSNTPDTMEAGAWQVSANSRRFGSDLQAISPADGDAFQHQMKGNRKLAMEYIARLLRHTVNHNGPVKRHEIDPWLSKDAVEEFEQLLM